MKPTLELLFTFIIILISNFHTISQDIDGKVLQSDNKNPVSLCHLKIGKQIAVTDSAGNFIIKVYELPLSIKISHIGFNDTLIKITDISNHLIIMLTPKVESVEEVVITANKSNIFKRDIPARIHIISKEQIDENTGMYADELLQILPGVLIDRDQGIYSRNSSITFRGLNGAQRFLILLDGTPSNKSDGGSVNWNRIITSNIEKIEVLKGPSSTIYGGAAMGGAVNIITHRPIKKWEVIATAFYGSFNTTGGALIIGGNNIKKNKGFWWQLYGHYRKGDGYIFDTDSLRDTTDIASYLWEYSSGIKSGYSFSSNVNTEFEYSFYDDKRSEGKQIFEPDGAFSKYKTHYFRTNTKIELGKTHIQITGYLQKELYSRQNESLSIKRGFKYKLYNTDTEKSDLGVMLNVTIPFNPNNSLYAGADLKTGNVYGKDIYYTTTDILTNEGRMDNFGGYALFEKKMLNTKLIFSAGLRYDFFHFHEGRFLIEEPTKESAFMVDYPDTLSENRWYSLSPKMGLRYNITENYGFYAAWSKGFRPPILDDMCRNGNITRGFKLSNPNLNPETIDNFEIGSDFRLFERILLQPTVYYSLGNDFMYFIGNGDSIASGDNPKPVLIRKNIGIAEIVGCEFQVNIKITKAFSFNISYAWNKSSIKEFKLREEENGADLTGKLLTDVPQNVLFSSFNYKSKFIHTGINLNYLGASWSDDENLIQNNPYWILNAFVSKEFFKNLLFKITINDLLNQRYINSKGQLSPGIFAIFTIIYKY